MLAKHASQALGDDTLNGSPGMLKKSSTLLREALPVFARFLSADPHVADASNGQAWRNLGIL